MYQNATAKSYNAPVPGTGGEARASAGAIVQEPALRMRISVIVPTYRRPWDLRRCLEALARQELAPFEVVVIHRAGDDDTLAVLRDFGEQLPLNPACVYEPGQVAALNRGLEAAAGDVAAITDDDAAPHPDWTRRIAAHFEADPKLTGLGGRDQVIVEGVRMEGACPEVGLVNIFGRCTGNHHLGVGPAREVDILKGANMSYRLAHLDGVRFDTRLLGAGAQVCNDLAFSLALRKRGRRLVYDPAVLVDHFPSVRHDDDRRHVFNAVARQNEAYNQTLALLDFLPAPRRLLFLCWAFAIGTRRTPGAAAFLVEAAVARNRTAGAAYLAAVTGLLRGTRAWCRTG